MKLKYTFTLLIFILLFTGLSAKNNSASSENDSVIIKKIPEKTHLEIILILNPKEKNLILNGDFEKGNTCFFSSLDCSTHEVAPGNYAITKNAMKHNLSFASVPDHTSGSGNYLLIDASPQENSKNWCSKVKIDPQSEYVFSLFASNVNTHYTKPANLMLTINGVQIGDALSLSDDNHEWIEYKWQWFSEKNKDSIDFCIQDFEGVADGNDYGIDDIRLYKISKEPEAPKENCSPQGDTLSPIVHFPFEESTITEFSKEKLKLLMAMLNKCPKMKIKILGHTDMFGTHTYNNDLSGRRAKVIFDYLQSNGISSERMIMEAMGESQILYQGKSKKDNVKNRRVRFVVNGYSD